MKQLFLTVTALSIAIVSFSQLPNYVPTDSLVGFWPFTTDSFDAGPHGYTAWIADPTPNQFTGTGMEVDPNYAIIDAISYPAIDFAGDFSVSLNFTNNSHVENNGASLLAQFSGTGSQFAGFAIHIDSTGPTSCVLKVNVSMAGTNAVVGTTNIYAYANHNVTVTLKSDTLIVYLDGNVEATGVGFSMSTINSTGLNFGNGNNDPTGQYIYNGKIWNAGLWNRALSPCEVLNLATESIFSAATIAGPVTVLSGDTITLYCQGYVPGAGLYWYDIGSQHTTYTNGQGTDSISIAFPPGGAGWDSLYLQESLLNGCTLTSNGYGITVLAPSAINTLSDYQKFNVYPNPACDELDFMWSTQCEAAGTIYDVSGKVVKQFDVKGNAINELDIHELASGSYTLRLVDKVNNGERFFKFTKL